MRLSGFATNWPPCHEATAAASLKDPWADRDAYIAFFLDRSPENFARFFAKQAVGLLDECARLSLLSEIPKTWCEAVSRWSALNGRYRHGEKHGGVLELILIAIGVLAKRVRSVKLGSFFAHLGLTRPESKTQAVARHQNSECGNMASPLGVALVV
jgi:hypothetical protein